MFAPFAKKLRQNDDDCNADSDDDRAAHIKTPVCDGRGTGHKIRGYRSPVGICKNQRCGNNCGWRDNPKRDEDRNRILALDSFRCNQSISCFTLQNPHPCRHYINTYSRRPCQRRNLAISVS